MQDLDWTSWADRKRTLAIAFAVSFAVIGVGMWVPGHIFGLWLLIGFLKSPNRARATADRLWWIAFAVWLAAASSAMLLGAHCPVSWILASPAAIAYATAFCLRRPSQAK